MNNLLRVAAERPNAMLREQWRQSRTTLEFLNNVRDAYPDEYARLEDLSGKILKCDKLAAHIRQRQQVDV
eukprot:4956389-Alexandrium_andersonii.AAC.1